MVKLTRIRDSCEARNRIDWQFVLCSVNPVYTESDCIVCSVNLVNQENVRLVFSVNPMNHETNYVGEVCSMKPLNQRTY